MPPRTETSSSTKSVDASEREKVRVAVSLMLNESSISSSVMAMVGRTLLTLIVIFAVSFSVESEALTVKMC